MLRACIFGINGIPALLRRETIKVRYKVPIISGLVLSLSRLWLLAIRARFKPSLDLCDLLVGIDLAVTRIHGCI